MKLCLCAHTRQCTLQWQLGLFQDLQHSTVGVTDFSVGSWDHQQCPAPEFDAIPACSTVPHLGKGVVRSSVRPTAPAALRSWQTPSAGESHWSATCRCHLSKSSAVKSRVLNQTVCACRELGDFYDAIEGNGTTHPSCVPFVKLNVIEENGTVHHSCVPSRNQVDRAVAITYFPPFFSRHL